MILPFDAHNHVHMGPTQPIEALVTSSDASNIALSRGSKNEAAVSGMAIMSTHPRDFDRVLHLSRNLPLEVQGRVQVVPCFGVHPWFLHELSDEDWQILKEESSNSQDTATATAGAPKWVRDLEHLIKANPNAIVGEIGLDGFHFDSTTEDLVSPMEKQVEAFRMQMELAFRMQMELAARLERPVSIHTVQCFGPLFDAITQIKKDAKQNKLASALPSKMYFHAFGGKVGTIDQILAMCGRKPGQVYFGFAPVVNFRSPKTADVIRKVGIDHLVLESDHEDAKNVPKSMEECVEFLATTLGIAEGEVIERTTANAFDLYGLN